MLVVRAHTAWTRDCWWGDGGGRCVLFAIGVRGCRGRGHAGCDVHAAGAFRGRRFLAGVGTVHGACVGGGRGAWHYDLQGSSRWEGWLEPPSPSRVGAYQWTVPPQSCLLMTLRMGCAVIVRFKYRVTCRSTLLSHSAQPCSRSLLRASVLGPTPPGRSHSRSLTGPRSPCKLVIFAEEVRPLAYTAASVAERGCGEQRGRAAFHEMLGMPTCARTVLGASHLVGSGWWRCKGKSLFGSKMGLFSGVVLRPRALHRKRGRVV